MTVFVDKQVSILTKTDFCIKKTIVTNMQTNLYVPLIRSNNTQIKAFGFFYVLLCIMYFYVLFMYYRVLFM